MLALAIIAAKSSKHRFPFHVGFNPTRVSELIMDLLRASHDDQKADDFAHPPCPKAISELMVTAELRRRDDQLMIVQICAARKVRAALHSGHAASSAMALLLKVKNPKAPTVKR
jgi:hypothetical protein